MNDTKHETKIDASHTPGPWEVVATVETQTVNIFGAAKNREYHIGTLTGSSKENLERFKADVRLMTSSPKLLAVLERCRPYVVEAAILDSGVGGRLALDALDAVIAEAKGQAA